MNYPTENKDVNLRVIQTLKKEFKYPIGFSDHTMSVEVPVASVALGATVVISWRVFDTDMPRVVFTRKTKRKTTFC